MKDFKKREIWERESGRGFAVEIVHWMSGDEVDCHRWNVYGRLTDEHPLFSKIDPTKHYYGQEIFESIPLPDINYVEMEKFGDFAVLVFGNDYCHRWNEGLESRESNIDYVPSVTGDAKRLFEWLENYSESPSNE